MFCITSESTDPFFNLAIEEVLLKRSREEYLILGINDPSVIIGKHQSAHREINTQYVAEKNIPVIRRITGGGTVFHDHGNLNFTFIRQSEPGKQIDFIKYTKPVINFLSSVGISAIFEGKNDLKVNKLKISGNAEHVYRNRVLHHGTLLFNTSLDDLRNALRKNSSCYSSRAVISNPSPVTNLKELLTGLKDVYALRTEMMNYLMEKMDDMNPYELSNREREEAESLADSKYRSWDWNYAYGPDYQFDNSFYLMGRLISCHLDVKEGIIRKCMLDGSSDIENISEALVGCRHMVEDVRNVFKEAAIFIPDSDIYNLF
jgi:lipoate---protein ligase